MTITVTGRGALPPLPSEPLRANNTVSVDWVRSDRNPTPNPSPLGREGGILIHNEIVEANGWIINDKGQVVLTTSGRTATPSGFGSTPPECAETATQKIR